MKFQVFISRFVHLIIVTYSYEFRNLESSHKMAANFKAGSSENLETNSSVKSDNSFSTDFIGLSNGSSTELPFSFDLLKSIKIQDVERTDTEVEFSGTPSTNADNVSVTTELQTTGIDIRNLTTNSPEQNQTLSNNATTKNDLNATSSPLPPSSTADVVVSSTNENVTFTNAVIRQTIVWLNDSYTVALLIPISAGLVIASTIIVTVAACKCLRRRCYRRRLRRKILPEDVKNMRPSDRAKLLAETSDEEF